jgi:hypothetical protein
MHCKNCNNNIDGRCVSDKIAEDLGQDDQTDMLLYDYNESGGFSVGDNFGCVHFKLKLKQPNTKAT